MRVSADREPRPCVSDSRWVARHRPPKRRLFGLDGQSMSGIRKGQPMLFACPLE